MTTATHTPTPWRYVSAQYSGVGMAHMQDGQFRSHPSRSGAAIVAQQVRFGGPPQGEFYLAVMNPIWDADQAEAEANAAHVVHCVNAHEPLKAALRAFTDLCPRMSDDDPIAAALADACKDARALLAEVDKA